MFNRKASDPKNKPEEVLKALGLQLIQKVADIGAGGGFYSLRFAEVVGTGGQVFAVETNPMFLEFIQARAKEKGLSNIETVLATKESAALPAKSLDLIFMRNVCHHLQKRVEYFRKLQDPLGKDGRIAIVEYKGGKGFSFHRLLGHYVPKEKIIREMKEAGFQLEKDLDFLPEQSFTIYSVEHESSSANSAKQ
jgi:ubiquinone/menaquinone biosynthesis C-methylase UbiE